MKMTRLAAFAVPICIAVSTATLGQAPPAIPPPPPMIPPPQPPAREVVNFVVRVEWKDVKGTTNFLQVLTAEGNFSLNTLLADRVKINNSDIPITVTLKGDLRVLNPEKGQLNLFLGRTVPYVTSTYGSGKEASSSYQQLQVGLSSTFAVTFGRPLVIQSDQREEVSILVKRAEN